MGCFSYICKECGKSIKSNSFRGERVYLFLLRDGEVVETMEGEYDSYGRVLTIDHKKSIEWSIDWGFIVDLHFDNDKGNGIAAIHKRCWKGDIPKNISENDPDQGWGDNSEYLGEELSGPFIDIEEIEILKGL
jgi:hypothetical protein